MLKNKIKVLIFYTLLWAAQSNYCSFNVTSFLTQNTAENIFFVTVAGAASVASGSLLTSGCKSMRQFQSDKENHAELSLAYQERINTIEAHLVLMLRHRSDHETVIHSFTGAPLPIVQEVIAPYLFDPQEEQKATETLAQLKRNNENHHSQKPSFIRHVAVSLPKIGRDTLLGGVGGGLVAGTLAIRATAPHRR